MAIRGGYDRAGIRMLANAALRSAAHADAGLAPTKNINDAGLEGITALARREGESGAGCVRAFALSLIALVLGLSGHVGS